jgi:DNA-binding MarR family transcriptional regulator
VTRSESPTALATEAWRAILDFIGATAWRRTRILAELGLTVNDSRALSTLESDAGRTMRSLADEWSCDASTATWIVDRLEKKGFAERRPDATDRRLRMVFLTPAGVRMREEMLLHMYAAPPELLDLEAADLVVLRDGVVRLPAIPPETSPRRSSDAAANRRSR